MARKEVEVWLAVDAEGGCEAGPDEGAAADRYADNVASHSGGFRLIKILVSVPLPTPMTARAVLEEDDPPVAAVEN